MKLQTENIKLKTELELRCFNFAVLKGLTKATESKEWIEVAEENVYKKLKWQK